MSAPLPIERVLLAKADQVLTSRLPRKSSTARYLQRLEVLEAAASLIGGFNLSAFRKACLDGEPLLTISAAVDAAHSVVHEIAETRIHPALALSALAREPLSKHETRVAGAHYTDFRLATLLASLAAEINPHKRPILDPASGSGMLLAAASISACSDGRTSAKWLAESVLAADQSVNALRGARLSLASLTNDVGAIARMESRWLRGDSLLRPLAEWRDACDGPLGAIVANPPWEKLKVLRHEYEVASGSARHYGAAHGGKAADGLLSERLRIREYADAVTAHFPLAGRGETDLFVAFTQLMIELAGDDAGIAALLPAGLIRSKSTTALRALLMDRFPDVSVTIIDNKPRFFEIDTRFKFVALTAGPKKKAAGSTIRVAYAQSDEAGCSPGPFSSIERQTLSAIRPDLSIPEVRSVAEWELFQRMAEGGLAWNDDSSPWWPEIVRELDMTRERPAFLPYPTPRSAPVAEGRMVHQFRFGAKVYVEGSGRRAAWAPVPLGVTRVEPQFWIRHSDLPAAARQRLEVARAGFCDIAGQTNERSMLAAVVPAGVACGNKVPTVLFPNLPSEDALHLWCGMVNSFAFDWMLRRVLTTTVNYFLLQSVPLPPLLPSTIPGRGVAIDARQVALLSGASKSDPTFEIAELRRSIDLICFRAYGLTADDVELVLEDFPSLDRTQPALPGEWRSTVTRDFILAALDGPRRAQFAARAAAAMEAGAKPYRPSQTAEAVEDAGHSRVAAT